MTADSGFFGTDEVEGTALRLLSGEHLTVVLGAGISVEAGLPTWRELVWRLLERLGERAGLEGAALTSYCEWTLRADGLTAAAAVVEANLDEADFRRLVREELYRGVTDGLVPGPSARACARLKAHLGERCELVTTNYDLLILDALRNEPIGEAMSVEAVTDDRPTTNETAYVRHLHGIVQPHRTAGDLVLAEGHYHAMQGSEQTWQEAFMRQRLRHSSCLFAGTSLTDPNLLRYLYRTGGNRPHAALFTRQDDAANRQEAGASVEGVRDETAKTRWRALNVEPLLADYYTEAAQFLWELVWLLESERGAPRYVERLTAWENAISRELTPRRNAQRFVEKQDELHDHLSAELDRVRLTLAEAGSKLRRGERLGLHLWVYKPSQRALLLIGASDRVWRDRSTLYPIPIEWGTSWAAVKAFCSGSLAARATEDQPATRWNHVVGIPLFSSERPWGRLPIGVLTIGSTLPEHRSVLGRGISRIRTLSWLLADRAAPLLLPPG